MHVDESLPAATVAQRAVIDHGVSQWGTYCYDGVSYSHDQVMDLCSGLIVLYLYSGPRRDGDFSEACLELGAKAKLIDIELDEPLMDVLDEAIFDTHLSDIKARKYDAALMAMPCSTFSRSRDVCDGGPKPLRGCGEVDIYGLPNLSISDKDKVRTGTILALRGEVVARTCTGMDIPWIAETPEHKVGKPSVLLLPEWSDTLKDVRVDRKTIVQCELGAIAKKATELWGTASLNDLPELCTHASQFWTIPWSGRSYWSAHPWLRGNQLAISSDLWTADSLRTCEPSGPYISRSAAMYPRKMNRELAFRLLMAAGLKRAKVKEAAKMVRVSKWSNSSC